MAKEDLQDDVQEEIQDENLAEENTEAGGDTDDDRGLYEPVELTEREKAIARGDNPDELEQDAADDDDLGDDVSDSTAEDEKPAWYRETDVELAKTYGLSEEDLREFRDEKEFLRAAKAIGKVQQQKFASTQDEAEQEEPEDPIAAILSDIPEEAKDEDGLILPEWFKSNGFDDESITLVKGMRALQMQGKRDAGRLEELTAQTQWLTEQMVAERQRQQEEMFHTALDALQPDFYGQHVDDRGRPVPLSEDHQLRRQKILEEAHAIGESIARQAEKQGVAPEYPTWDEMVRRAQQNIFSKDIEQMEKKNRTSKLAAQSRRRRPVGGSAGARKGTAALDPTSVEAIAANPEVAKFFTD